VTPGVIDGSVNDTPGVPSKVTVVELTIERYSSGVGVASASAPRFAACAARACASAGVPLGGVADTDSVTVTVALAVGSCTVAVIPAALAGGSVTDELVLVFPVESAPAEDGAACGTDVIELVEPQATSALTTSSAPIRIPG